VIRHLIWDVDGTLFDTYPSIVRAFQQTLNSFDRVVSPEEILPLAREGLSHCARVLSSQHQLPEREVGSRFSEKYASIPKTLQPPFPGAVRVCEAVVRLGGINAAATHRARASTEELLAAHKMRHLFADIVAGDDGFPRKPDPASFLAVLSRNALRAGETATVGDRTIDIQAGKAAGVRSCLFTAEQWVSEADFVFTSYSELLRYLLDSQCPPDLA
jgi:phosphoglycolate phosphatase-like HAD superfamily hydrolase